MDADTCVSCGEIVPEGQQLCWACKSVRDTIHRYNTKEITCEICPHEDTFVCDACGKRGQLKKKVID